MQDPETRFALNGYRLRFHPLLGLFRVTVLVDFTVILYIVTPSLPYTKYLIRYKTGEYDLADTYKKFILNADDFGMTKAYNTAIMEGAQKGFLKSTSLVANGEAFHEAIEKVIPACSALGVGVHLNIIEGKALLKEQRELTDGEDNFNNSYLKLILKAYKPGNKGFMEQLENEFRAQIEKIRHEGIKITHIDSHVHTHAIPPIFKLVCKLAREYEIPQVRTQYEHLYIVPDIYTHLNLSYPINLVKIALLNMFTMQNKPLISKFGLSTNDYLLGVGYTSMMTGLTISCGLAPLKAKGNIVVEALIHPCRYEDGTIDNHFTEFRITQSEKLKNKIEQMGFEITNYRQNEPEQPIEQG